MLGGISDGRGTHGGDRAATVIIVVAMAVLELLVLLAQPWTSTVERVIDLTSALVALLLVPVLVRRPVAGGILLGVLAAVSPIATPAATCATLYVAQRCSLRSSVAVAGVGVVGHLIQGWWRPIDSLPYWWWVVLVVVTYTTLVGWGFYLQARRSLIVSLRERAELAEADQARRLEQARSDERANVAREMHDVLAHRLSLVATHAGALEFRPDAAPEQVAQAAGVVRAGVHQALDDLRQVVQVLRTPHGPGLTHPAPPQPTLADLPDLIADNRAVGVDVDVRDSLIDRAQVPSRIGRTAYRVLQEALTNARRHAPGHRVHVDLSGSPGRQLTVLVRNAMSPTSTQQVEVGAGSGLTGIRERVELEGGQVQHGQTGTEFCLVARLPWPD